MDHIRRKHQSPPTIVHQLTQGFKRDLVMQRFCDKGFITLSKHQFFRSVELREWRVCDNKIECQIDILQNYWFWSKFA